MKYLAILFLIFTPTGLFAQEDKPATPRIATRIDLGETIDYHGTTITFLEVLEDSRCPTDVVCVWAGQAKVKLKVVTENTEEMLELIVMKKDQDIVLVEEEYITKAAVLNPYPTTKNMGNRNYTLLIIRRKKDQ